MNERTSGQTSGLPRVNWAVWRRRLRRRRRTVAAGLAFVAVLAAGSALRPGSPAHDQPEGGSPASRLEIPSGLVAAPVRVAEPSVAELVGAGDVVDVVAADPRGRTFVVAPGAIVVRQPPATSGSFGPDPLAGVVLLVAVPETTALALAGATVTAQLSLVIPAE